MINVKRYTPEHEIIWDRFVKSSKNGLFFFLRKFQDYHSDRFQDHSLLIFEGQNLVAIFPANERELAIYTHQGLTYGGIVVGPEVKMSEYFEIFDHIISYYRNHKYNEIFYKPIPHIFTGVPSNEDIYWLFHYGAHVVKREISSVLSFENTVPMSMLRKRMIKKASAFALKIEEVQNVALFYKVLSATLQNHDAKPTHSLEELQRLKESFPDEIRVFVALSNDTVLAGTVIFSFNNVAHTQYLASTSQGKEIGALDLVIEHCLGIFKHKKYFSFGTSTIDREGKFNSSLVRQKEGFGARSINVDCYQLKL